MLDNYNWVDNRLGSVKHQLYYDEVGGYFVIGQYFDHPGVISDQYTRDNWNELFETGIRSEAKYDLYHNPVTRCYIVALYQFGRSVQVPDGYFLCEEERSTLTNTFVLLSGKVTLSVPRTDVINTEVVAEAEEPVYTESQVITLVKMVRGDLNVPGSDEMIKQLLRAI